MDLQVVYMNDVLPINSAQNVPGMEPRTVEIIGEDFRSVDKVFLNEEESPSFVVASSTRLLAQVPPGQVDATILSISVLSSEFTATEASRLSFELTDNPRVVSGIQRMVQTFVMLLLRSPGTDAWSQGTGGGLQEMIGKNFSKQNAGGATAQFAMCVRRTKSQLVSMQTRNTSIKDDGALAAAIILESVFDPRTTSLIARVLLRSRSGKAAVVNLEM
mgnify:FL=1